MTRWLAALLVIATAPAAGLAREVRVETDFHRARELARASGRDLLLEIGAEWCPPCRHLREVTFRSARFAECSRDVVVISVDAETPEGSAVVERYGATTYPTLLVVDAESSEELARREFDAGPQEACDLIAFAHGAASGRRRGVGLEPPAALAIARSNAPMSARVEALATYLYATGEGREARCAEGLPLLSKLGEESAVCVAWEAFSDCGLATGTLGARASSYQRTRKALESCAAPGRSLRARSGSYWALVPLLAVDPPAKAAAERRWLALAETAANDGQVWAVAALARLREVDPPRVLAAISSLAARRPDDLLLALSEAEALRRAGRIDDALAAADRAVRLAHGAAALRALQERAASLRALGDRRRERETIREALDLAPTLPRTQLRASEKQIISDLKRRDAELADPPAPP